MNKETKLILINQLRIMLSSGIKETQRMLEKELLTND